MVIHPSQLAPEELLAECAATRTRRSGPGGQHRNKVETAVILTHTATGISAEANERRSQHANREQALVRLRLRLAIEIRTPAEAPSELWASRVRGDRIFVNSEHVDFPPLLAEAFNHLAVHEFEPRPASEALGISATQLVNLIKKHSAAFTKLNIERTQRGLHPLR